MMIVKLSARKHWSINSYSPASPRLSVVTGDRDPEGDPEGEALASMLKRTGRRDRDLLKLTWTKMSERKVQKSDHQLPFLIELATQLNFFFLARNKRFGGLIRTGLRMKQGSYVFSVWIFRMRKRAQRMSIFKRNSINSNVQQNLPNTKMEHRTLA